MIGLPQAPEGIMLAWDAAAGAGFESPTADLRSVISLWTDEDRHHLHNGSSRLRVAPEWPAFVRVCMTVFAIERGGYAIGRVHEFDLTILHAAPLVGGRWLWDYPTMMPDERLLIAPIWKRYYPDDVAFVKPGGFTGVYRPGPDGPAPQIARELAVALGGMVIPSAKYARAVL